MQHEPHQYTDQGGNGYCFVCGLKKSHPEANHTVKALVDKLSTKLIECLGCNEWNHTIPTEGVAEQSLRTCLGCAHDFLIDYETTEMREEEPTDSEGDTAAVWLARQFEFEYCHECGKDTDKHTAVMVLGNWFARCDEPEPVKVYECGICDHVHPWEFDGDCREDANRYAGYEDYAERNNMSSCAVTVLTWEDRQEADNGEAQQTTD